MCPPFLGGGEAVFLSSRRWCGAEVPLRSSGNPYMQLEHPLRCLIFVSHPVYGCLSLQALGVAVGSALYLVTF